MGVFYLMLAAYSLQMLYQISNKAGPETDQKAFSGPEPDRKLAPVYHVPASPLILVRQGAYLRCQARPQRAPLAGVPVAKSKDR
jgi:hypothetical protein